MQRRNLREILQDKINKDYLGKDNRESSLFSFISKEGRIRANQLLAEKIEPLNCSDNQLILELHKEITSEKSTLLGSSTQLRQRLMEGLCEYFGKSQEQIESEALANYQKFCQGGYGMSMPAFNKELSCKSVMLQLLETQVQQINKVTLTEGTHLKQGKK